MHLWSARWQTKKKTINNSGDPSAGTFDTFDDDDWRRACELALLSFIRAVREVLAPLTVREKSLSQTRSREIQTLFTSVAIPEIRRTGGFLHASADMTDQWTMAQAILAGQIHMQHNRPQRISVT